MSLHRPIDSLCNINKLFLILCITGKPIQTCKNQALDRAIEQVKLTNFNGKSDVEEFIADYLDIVHYNGWSDSQSPLQLRLALTGEAAVCKRGHSVELILDDLREVW